MSTRLNINNNDLELMFNGDKFPVAIGPNLRRNGWRAGTWVKYVPNEFSATEFTVEKSEGIYAAGFLLYPSEDYSDSRTSNYRNFTSFQVNISPTTATSGSGVTTMISGGTRILTRNYETTALDNLGVRNNGTLNYSLNSPLYISENGILTQDPPANLILATGGDSPLFVGICSKVPTTDDPRLGADIKY
jgi:hypothetical protein